MKIYYTLIFTFISGLLIGQIFPVSQIVNNGSDAQRINYLMLSDGYTSAQLPTFITDATNITADFFNKTPFAEYSDFFNVYVIEVPSVEGGADHPGTATDVTEPAFPVSNVNTYFGSTFDYYNIHRLLVPTNSAAINTVLANNYPGSDQVIIVVNSPHYGGSGGTYATNSLNAAASELAIHEVGHSFANLADEYNSGATSEKANRTAESDPTLVRWADWVGSNGIGVYPISPAVNRPHQNCEMRYLNREFCAVCREAIIDRIYALVDPIDAYSPSTSSVNFTGATLDFSLDLVLPNPNTLEIEWILNGTSFATTDVAIMLNTGDLPLVTNTLVANITDETLLSKTYLPASGYLFSVSWTIENTSLPVELLDFKASSEESHVALNWSTIEEVGLKKYIIERAKSPVDFSKIGEVSVIRNTQDEKAYVHLDLYPLEGKSYYRLKIIDQDGSFDYSPVRTVNRIEKFFYKFYPNPSQDFIYFDYFTNTSEANFIVNVLNANGGLLQTIQTDGIRGHHKTRIDISNYPAGIYFLQIENEGYLRKLSFVKE